MLARVKTPTPMKSKGWSSNVRKWGSPVDLHDTMSSSTNRGHAGGEYGGKGGGGASGGSGGEEGGGGSDGGELGGQYALHTSLHRVFTAP